MSAAEIPPSASMDILVKRKHSCPSASKGRHVITPTDAVGHALALGVTESESPPPKKRSKRNRPASMSARGSVVPGGTAYASLPPVTVSHLSGAVAPTLGHRVSYGELTLDEIAAVLRYREMATPATRVSGPSPPLEGAPPMTAYVQALSADHVSGEGDESDPGSDVGHASQNPFVDDMAEEHDGESTSCSGSEHASDDEDDGLSDASAYHADSSLTAIVVPRSADRLSSSAVAPAPTSGVRVSARAKTKTEKGEYIKSLLDRGQAGDLASDDDVRGDPTVALSATKSKRAGKHASHVAPRAAASTAAVQDPVPPSTAPAAGVAPSAEVYLKDLGYPPVPVHRPGQKVRSGKLKSRKVPPVPVASTLHVVSNAASVLDGNVPVGAFVKTLVTGSRGDLTVRPGPGVAGNCLPVSSVNAPPGLTGMSAIPPADGSVRSSLPDDASGAMPAALDPFLAGLDAFIGDCAASEPESDRADEPGPAAPVPIISPSPYPDQPTDEPAEEHRRVMRIELQEEQLRSHYAILPSIGHYRCIVAPGTTEETFDHPPCITLDEILRFFPRDVMRSFIASLKFFGHAPYCNLSSMPRNAFCSDGKKALYSGKTAVAMMVGVVTACSLHRLVHEGGYNAEAVDPNNPPVEGGRAYRSLTLMPFRQLWRRESTMLSMIFRLPFMKSTSISSKGPEFTTRAYTSTTGFNRNKVLSPAQQKSHTSASGGSSQPSGSGSAWPGSPSKQGSLASAPKDYYHCLGFEDDVPVFDGRVSKHHHFLFRPSDFDNLTSMPRYNHDLDYFSLVAVGYTPGVWSTKREAHLSLNVQFVVLLGQAPDAAELAAAGYVE